MMIPELKLGDLVEVVLDDLTTEEDEWISLEKASVREPVVVHAVGYYLNHDERAFRLTPLMIRDGSWVGSTIVFPTGAVREINVRSNS